MAKGSNPTLTLLRSPRWRWAWFAAGMGACGLLAIGDTRWSVATATAFGVTIFLIAVWGLKVANNEDPAIDDRASKPRAPARPSKTVSLMICLAIALSCGYWLVTVLQGAEVTWRGVAIDPAQRPFRYAFKVGGFAIMTIGFGGLFLINIIPIAYRLYAKRLRAQRPENKRPPE